MPTLAPHMLCVATDPHLVGAPARVHREHSSGRGPRRGRHRRLDRWLQLRELGAHVRLRQELQAADRERQASAFQPKARTPTSRMGTACWIESATEALQLATGQPAGSNDGDVEVDALDGAKDRRWVV